MTRADFNECVVKAWLTWRREQLLKLNSSAKRNSVTSAWAGTGLHPYNRKSVFWEAAISTFGKRETLSQPTATTASNNYLLGVGGVPNTTQTPQTATTTTAVVLTGEAARKHAVTSSIQAMKHGGAPVELQPVTATGEHARTTSTLVATSAGFVLVPHGGGAPQTIAPSDIAEKLAPYFDLPNEQPLSSVELQAVRKCAQKKRREDEARAQQEIVEEATREWHAKIEALRVRCGMSPELAREWVELLKNPPPKREGDIIIWNSVMIGRAIVIDAAVEAAMAAPMKESVKNAAERSAAKAAAKRGREASIEQTTFGKDVTEELGLIEERQLANDLAAEAKKQKSENGESTQANKISEAAAAACRKLLASNKGIDKLDLGSLTARVKWRLPAGQTIPSKAPEGIDRRAHLLGLWEPVKAMPAMLQAQADTLPSVPAALVAAPTPMQIAYATGSGTADESDEEIDDEVSSDESDDDLDEDERAAMKELREQHAAAKAARTASHPATASPCTSNAAVDATSAHSTSINLGVAAQPTAASDMPIAHGGWATLQPDPSCRLSAGEQRGPQINLSANYSELTGTFGISRGNDARHAWTRAFGMERSPSNPSIAFLRTLGGCVRVYVNGLIVPRSSVCVLNANDTVRISAGSGRVRGRFSAVTLHGTAFPRFANPTETVGWRFRPDSAYEHAFVMTAAGDSELQRSYLASLSDPFDQLPAMPAPVVEHRIATLHPVNRKELPQLGADAGTKPPTVVTLAAANLPPIDVDGFCQRKRSRPIVVN